MTGKDAARYLANLLVVAKSDGQLNPKEEAGLDRVLNDLGAAKRAMTDARQIAEEQSYQPTPVGRYSDQIRNLEDMVFISITDGKLEIVEKTAILAFAKLIGVRQEQMDLILSQSQSRVKPADKEAKELKETAALPKQIGEASPGKTTALDYPTEGISIEFPESQLGNFDAALKAARAAQRFQECVRDKTRWFLCTWPKDRMLEVAKMADLLKGEERRKAYVAGKPTDWDDLFGFVPCMQQRQSAYLPAEHCFGVDENILNIWGCKENGMHWSEFSQWFTFGHFKQKDVFVFDKKKIQAELEAASHRYRFCPFLRLPLIKTLLQLFPEEVTISRKSGWKYRGNAQETPNSIKVTIQEATADGAPVLREIYARGVAPIGFAVAKDMLRQAFSKCGITDVSYLSLIPS